LDVKIATNNPNRGGKSKKIRTSKKIRNSLKRKTPKSFKRRK
jgi:hypothetical protein